MSAAASPSHSGMSRTATQLVNGTTDSTTSTAGTVKTHVAAILRKLDRRDRTQAAVAAYELGLVRPGG